MTALTPPATTNQILDLLNQPEGPSLEFKSVIPNGLLLAQKIAGMNNAGGGTIVAGVDGRSRTVVGCDRLQLAHVVDAAMKRLHPKPHGLRLHGIQLREGWVEAIEVPPSKELMLADTGAYIRDGDHVRVMLPAEIVQRLSPAPSGGSLEWIATALTRQTVIIEQLQNEHSRANSFRGKWKDYLIGFVVGVLSSLVAAFIYLAVVGK